MQAKFKLGDELKDVVTGAKGVVMAILFYYTGCVHYALSPRKQRKEGGDPDWNYYDESRLVSTGGRINLPGQTKEPAMQSGAFPRPPRM